jgi:hypothetical protein
VRNIISINQNWYFSKEATAVPEALCTDWEAVNVPHCWNAVDGQDGGNDYWRGTAYYAKSIVKADLPVSDCYYLEIQGANSSAEVYLNGTLVTTHYASNGQAKLGFKNGYNTVYLCSDSKTNSTVNFETSSLARYLGTTQFKDMTVVYENAITASDITAVINDYNATAKNYTENVYVTAYTASGRTHYAWNELNTLAGANNFGTYGLGSDIYKLNGAYMRVKNIQIGYK